MTMLTVTGDWSWLENSPLAAAIRQWLWLYPAIEVLHILGLAIAVGSVAMFDLRLLGVSRQVFVTDMAQHLLPWACLGFTITILSGLLLFSVDAGEIAENSVFRLKLLLIAAVGVNAVWFHGRVFRSVRLWNRGTHSPIAARTIAVISLILWTGIIVCGRLIAYL